MSEPSLTDRVAALEAWRASLDSPPTEPAAQFPADLFGPGWKLTLPSAKEVLQPELAAYASPEFCFADSNRAVVRFRVAHGSATTPASNNPRCELREMAGDGRKLAKWSTTSGRHSLSAVLQVNRLTRQRPHLVVAQIHGGDDDVTVWRVEGPKLWITAGDNTHAYLVDSAFQLGASFTIGFDVEAGHVLYRYNGRRVDYALKVRDPGCYFKIGAYLQSNSKTAPGGSTSEYAEVVIAKVAVTHI